MKKKFPYIKIPDHLKSIVGPPDEDTRIYRCYSTREDLSKMFDTVLKICDSNGTLSPGGVAGYVGVTRAAVHKRLKEGRLTGFFFHVIKDKKFLNRIELLEELGYPYVFIPVSECKAWRREFRKKKYHVQVEENASSKGHESDRFMKPPFNWRKKINK